MSNITPDSAGISISNIALRDLTIQSVDSVSFRNVHVAWSCETTTCNKTLETSDVPGFKLSDDCVLDPPPGNR